LWTTAAGSDLWRLTSEAADGEMAEVEAETDAVTDAVAEAATEAGLVASRLLAVSAVEGDGPPGPG
jgi:hypothetical protein